MSCTNRPTANYRSYRQLSGSRLIGLWLTRHASQIAHKTCNTAYTAHHLPPLGRMNPQGFGPGKEMGKSTGEHSRTRPLFAQCQLSKFSSKPNMSATCMMLFHGTTGLHARWIAPIASVSPNPHTGIRMLSRLLTILTRPYTLYA